MTGGDYCIKNDFYFHEKEALNCVCDDYAPWKIPFIITDNPPDYATDIVQEEL